MEKRTAQLTIMIEPTVHKILKDNFQNVSSTIHDIILSYLSQEGLLNLGLRDDATQTQAVTWAEPEAGTITKMCTNCNNQTPADLVWSGKAGAYHCHDLKMCYANMQKRKAP